MKSCRFIISLSLSLVLFFRLLTPVASAEITNSSDANVSNFGVVESIGDNYEIIRTYEKQHSSTPYSLRNTDLTLSETELLLQELGMDPRFIKHMSTEKLQFLASCETITTYTSYTKNNDSGVTYLPEATALQESAELKQLQINEFEKNTNLSRSTESAATNPIKDFYNDSYMSLSHTVAYDGDATYLFITDAIWLTMPLYRAIDSLGSCAMGCTVTPGSQSGYYLYSGRFYANGELIHTEDEFKNITTYGNAINGNWYGSAGSFDLPDNAIDNSVMFVDFCARFDYYGHVHDPDSSKWINSVGTYEHTTLGVVLNQAMNIEVAKHPLVSATIGLDSIASSEVRAVELEIYYTPD